MAHRPMYRRLTRGIWSAGCSCGWLCDHPMRGERSRAVAAWKAHQAHVESDRLGRLMTEPPRPNAKRGD